LKLNANSDLVEKFNDTLEKLKSFQKKSKIREVAENIVAKLRECVEYLKRLVRI
jgi:hypothetical protein